MSKRILPEGMGFLEALNLIIRSNPKNWKKPAVKEKEVKKNTPLK